MVIIKPFKGIRPAKDKVHLVASRSVDTYKPQQLNSKLAENSYTFLHVIKPEFGEAVKNKINSSESLKKIKTKFNRFVNEGIFRQDQTEGFYLYQQIKDGDTFTGIIGCAAIDDYFNGVIKVHEQTITSREEKLKNYLEICDFNAEPICMSYPDDKKINKIMDRVCEKEPLYDFTTTDRVRHKLWLIQGPEEVQDIISGFEKIPAIYIADGHHRSASSALLGKSKREKFPNYTGREAFNYFMVIFFPESQLKIYDYNRIVKDLNGLSAEEFLKKISEKFDIEEKDVPIYQPGHLHNFSMYLDGKWYSLTAKKGTYNDNDPIGILDAAILSEHILAPVLNITDLKTDKRIAFVSGIKGMEELKNQVDSGRMKVAFGLYPATMEQIKKIADTGNIMPPKTTWVEPKLRSGLVVYSLSE